MLALIPPQIVTAVIATQPAVCAARAARPRRGAARRDRCDRLHHRADRLACSSARARVLLGRFLRSSRSSSCRRPSSWQLRSAGGRSRRLSRNMGVAGFLLLVTSYVLTYALFRVFFNYEFLQGAPVYLESAPHGMFNGGDRARVLRDDAGWHVSDAALRPVAADLVTGVDEAARARPGVDDHRRGRWRDRHGGDDRVDWRSTRCTCSRGSPRHSSSARSSC